MKVLKNAFLNVADAIFTVGKEGKLLYCGCNIQDLADTPTDLRTLSIPDFLLPAFAKG